MPNDKQTSLKPTKEWWDKNYAEVKAANSDYSEEKIEKAVGAIWYKNMSTEQKKKRREDEGKKYGEAKKAVSFSKFSEMRMRLIKSFYHKTFTHLEQPEINELTDQSLSYSYFGETEEPQAATIFKGVKGIGQPRYRAKRNDDLKYNPAVIVSCYDKQGKFESMEVHPAPEILKSPEKYDEDTFWFIIHNLSAERWNHSKEKVELLSKCISELKTRDEEREKEMKKIVAVEPTLEVPSNWELEQRYFFGKSFVFLADVNV
jgi:hypothetical protein